MKFINFIADDIVDENSTEYQQFLASEIESGLETNRIKSGNSLRDII